MFGIHIVYLNTLEVANDLFEKRSATYSDRPRLVMANEVLVVIVILLECGGRSLILQNWLGVGNCFHALWSTMAEDAEGFPSVFPAIGSAIISAFPVI